MKNHFVSIKGLDKSFVEEVFKTAYRLETLGTKKVPFLMQKKIMATLFYQPSTRTRLSFESAMLKLGGRVISTENAKEFSSTMKGETLEDTIRVVSGYSDVIVLRHEENGAAVRAAKVSDVPVINAGDGNNEHPTQALLDLYTIKREKGILPGMNIGLIGDLKNGRTVHSLLGLLELYDDLNIFLIAPRDLATESNLNTRHPTYWFESWDECLGKLDVIYMTRVQNRSSIDVNSGYYVIDQRNKDIIKKDAIIMHPLPRLEEISPTMDSDPRSVYFKQAQYGLYIRMALITSVLDTPLA